ncbi:hypothetical protein HAX54_029471 [Datura stramonium]|uniref:Transmembrane protein n=1 Tax=Datura stramonium TaxID=4076 RepID=A0ABS8SAA2_DATST|nr:hypothetical protein [Datura stramonium]
MNQSRKGSLHKFTLNSFDSHERIRHLRRLPHIQPVQIRTAENVVWRLLLQTSTFMYFLQKISPSVTMVFFTLGFFVNHSSNIEKEANHLRNSKDMREYQTLVVENLDIVILRDGLSG